jgi:hypothetical protein
MDEATIALTAMTGLLSLSFLGFLIWGIRSGQFQNVEEAKYQIFRNNRKADNPQPGSQGKDGEAGGGDTG